MAGRQVGGSDGAGPGASASGKIAGATGGILRRCNWVRAVVGALRGIDAALETGEALGGAAVDIAKRSIPIQFVEGGGAGILDVMGPELGFNTSEAPEEPIGADEGINEETFERGGRLPISW
jgi:hypothetical protein